MLHLYWVAITKEGMATYLSTRPLTNTKEGVAAPAWLSLGQISFLALLTPIYMKFSFALRYALTYIAVLFRRSARHRLRLGLGRGEAGGKDRNVRSIWNRSHGTRKLSGKHPLDR